MFTKLRMDKLYQKSKKIPINNQSQLVFMSDIHRGDNSVSDEFGQNRLIYNHALQYYNSYRFTYVEVGDGDELWEVPKYQYIRSAHPDTFDILREFHGDGRLIMLSGNHNSQVAKPEYVKRNMERQYDRFLDETVETFPGLQTYEAVTFTYENTGQELFVCHGHQGQVFNDYLAGIGMVTNRYIWRFIHKAGFRYTANPVKNRYRTAATEKRMKRWLDGNDLILICGHTHRPRLPAEGEPAYFNTGCAIHPRGITCLELSFGQAALVMWTLHTRNDGMVYVRHSTLKGPVSIESFS